MGDLVGTGDEILFGQIGTGWVHKRCRGDMTRTGGVEILLVTLSFFRNTFVYSSFIVFQSRARDSTPRFVRPSVCPSVGRSVSQSVGPSHFYFFYQF